MTDAAALFGDHVDVSRGLAEFRSGRPVFIDASGESLLTLPVESLDARKFAAFCALCAPARPRLIVTARRARSLDIETATPVTLHLTADCDAVAVAALVADATIDRIPRTTPAGPAALAALGLAKLSQGLPAVLAIDARHVDRSAFDPPLIAVAADALARYREDALRSLTIASEASVPLHSTSGSRFVVFRDGLGETSVAVIVGQPDFSKPVPVRLHSACLTGDVFGSRRCDCGDQLDLALERLEAAGGGVILYLAQEGRGVGLVNKMRAYTLQDAGLDTVDANTTLGFDDDERDYAVAGRMLEMLGCTRVLLLTNNPNKIAGLSDSGIDIVERLALETPIHSGNRRYMTAKAVRAGHQLEHVIDALRLGDSGDELMTTPAEAG